MWKTSSIISKGSEDRQDDYSRSMLHLWQSHWQQMGSLLGSSPGRIHWRVRAKPTSGQKSKNLQKITFSKYHFYLNSHFQKLIFFLFKALKIDKRLIWREKLKLSLQQKNLVKTPKINKLLGQTQSGPEINGVTIRTNQNLIFA